MKHFYLFFLILLLYRCRTLCLYHTSVKEVTSLPSLQTSGPPWSVAFDPEGRLWCLQPHPEEPVLVFEPRGALPNLTVRKVNLQCGMKERAEIVLSDSLGLGNSVLNLGQLGLVHQFLLPCATLIKQSCYLLTYLPALWASEFFFFFGRRGGGEFKLHWNYTRPVINAYQNALGSGVG